MYERGNYLKRAFYHIMKLEMKKNKTLKFEGYQKVNAKLLEMYSRGQAFENSVVYVEDGELCVSREFFKLPMREQEAMVEYLSQGGRKLSRWGKMKF